LADCLAEEILTEVAQNFFGKRRLMEKRIQLLQEYASELHQIGSQLDQQLMLLHYLLIDPQNTAEFYQKIGLSQPADQLPPKFTRHLIPICLPMTFTLSQKYFQLVLAVYENIQKGCHDYMHGNYSEETSAPDYRLFKKMCDLVNKEIKKLNQECSPTAVIQYMKNFDVIGSQKERVVGGHMDRERCGLNGKLAFKPIKLDAFKIKTYPDFPVTEKAGAHIKSLCKSVYREFKEDVRQVLQKIKRGQ
jgi:hypothetical protein